MRRNTFLVLAWVAGATVSGCGLFEPGYEKYATEAEQTPDDPCVTAALAEFAAQIAPAVDNTCATSTCHALTSIEGKQLAAGNNALNRTQLKAYTGSDANVLFDKISLNGTTHTGADQSAALPKANIEAWLAKEICN